MATYGSSGYDKLSRFVNRILIDKDPVKTGLKKTAWLNALQQKKKTKSGGEFEFPVRNALPDSVHTFQPDGGATYFDYIGDTPAVYPVDTYTTKNPVTNGQAKFSFAVEDIRLNLIQMRQSEGEGKFMDYMENHFDYINDSMSQFMANQILNGTGDGLQGTLTGVTGSDLTNWYGLDYQERAYSGGDNYATALTSSNANGNTHFNLSRHLFPALVGNVVDAAHVDGGTAGLATLTETGVTLTNGSTLVTGATSRTWESFRNYRIRYRLNGSGDPFVDMGREYSVASALTAAGTTFNMSQVFRGTNGTYDLEVHPFYTLAGEGDDNLWTYNKVVKAYLTACDGNERPDFGRCNWGTFYGFKQHMQALQRFTGEDDDLTAKGYNNFIFEGARIVIDEHEASNQLSFCTSKYVDLIFQKGYDKMQLTKKGLFELNDGRSVETLGGHVVVGGQVVNRAPNRSVKIINLGT